MYTDKKAGFVVISTKRYVENALLIEMIYTEFVIMKTWLSKYVNPRW